MNISSDFYKDLQLNNNATDNEIKQQYKKLAKKYHPDRNNGKEEQFKKIQNAYEILSDKQKKHEYDNRNNRRPVNIFSSMFRNFNVKLDKTVKINSDINITIKFKLSEIFNGGKRQVTYNRKIQCTKCNGIGCEKMEHLEECVQCRGNGIIKSVINLGTGFSESIQTCRRCSGSGNYIDTNNRCKQCSGNKMCNKREKIIIQIPKGVKNNIKIAFPNLGNGNMNLVVLFTELEDLTYERNGNHLIFIRKINIYKMINYIEFVNHPVLGDILLEYDKAINLNKIYYVSNDGFPINSEKKGNLYIKFIFDYIEQVDLNLIKKDEFNIEDNTDYKKYNIK